MIAPRPIAAAGAGFLSALALASSLYVVGQDRQAVVLRLGDPVRVVNPIGRDAPGLYLKWPFVERVARLDKRSLALEGEPLEIIAADRAALVIDPVVDYRVTDPVRAYRALDAAAPQGGPLQRMLDDSLRQVLGKTPSEAIIDAPTGAPRDPLMDAAAADLRRRVAAARLGIEVQAISLRRVGQSASDVQATLQRMQAGQQSRAAEIRASGEEQKRQVMADADRQATVLRAAAQGQALQIRGEGDAKRMEVLGAAYGADPEFARYFRNLEAYENAFENTGTVMVLSPDTAFMRDFRQGPTGK